MNEELFFVLLSSGLRVPVLDFSPLLMLLAQFAAGEGQSCQPNLGTTRNWTFLLKKIIFTIPRILPGSHAEIR